MYNYRRCSCYIKSTWSHFMYSSFTIKKYVFVSVLYSVQKPLQKHDDYFNQHIHMVISVVCLFPQHLALNRCIECVKCVGHSLSNRCLDG